MPITLADAITNANTRRDWAAWESALNFMRFRLRYSRRQVVATILKVYPNATDADVDQILHDVDDNRTPTVQL